MGTGECSKEKNEALPLLCSEIKIVRSKFSLKVVV